MDLRAFLLRRTVPCAFVVAGVGGADARRATERVLRLRGWRQALSPAEANMLVLCAPAGHGLDDVMDRLWDQVPGPRARTHVVTAEEAEPGLDAAAAMLAEPAHQRADAAGRPAAPTPHTTATTSESRHADAGPEDHGMHQEHSGHHGHETDGPSDHGGTANGDAGHGRDDNGNDAEDTAGKHGDHDMTGHGADAGHDRTAHDGHAGHNMTKHDMTAHGAHRGHAMSGHGHAGHDMSGMQMPGGLAMADRGEDRDGLMLDRLHVPLGPALPDWPAGLVIRLTVQGDVVQEADVAVHTGSGELPPRRQPADSEHASEEPLASVDPARRLDSLQRLLFVAGWPAAAMTARRLRDDLAASGATPQIRHEYSRWSRRVRRSRLMRWSTGGLGVLGAEVPPQLRGDATARWTRWLDEVDAAIEGPPVDEGASARAADAARAALDVLPGLLVGQELAAARLIVASLDPDVDALVAAHHAESTHG